MAILVVGLGNPGKQYKLNRHNIGYNILENIIQKYDLLVVKKKYIF